MTTVTKKRRGLAHMQPVGIGTKLNPLKPKQLKSKGTIANPYVRELDGARMVKVTFSISVPVVEKLQQFELKLKREGIGRNTWVEALIAHGIKTDFMRGYEEGAEGEGESETEAEAEQSAGEEQAAP